MEIKVWKVHAVQTRRKEGELEAPGRDVYVLTRAETIPQVAVSAAERKLHALLDPHDISFVVTDVNTIGYPDSFDVEDPQAILIESVVVR